MLEKQSLDDFVTRINSGKAVIVSVSPQSRASLAAFFGLSQSQVNICFTCPLPSQNYHPIRCCNVILKLVPYLSSQIKLQYNSVNENIME
jgi:hypothetical protein